MPQAKIRLATTITACLLVLFQQLQAQDSLKLRKLMVHEMKPLVAKRMKGRGYTGGDSTAAIYLEGRLRQIARSKAGPERRTSVLPAQVSRDTFMMAVNVFGQRQNFRLGRQSLRPGTDFVTEPDCPSVKQNYQLYATDTVLADSLKAHQSAAWVLPIRFKARVLKLAREQNLRPAAYIWLETAHKITWSVADDQSAIPAFVIKNDIWQQYRAATASVDISAQLNPTHHAHNVWLDLPALPAATAGTASDSILYITAHYDHLGQFGSATYYGANDNASGVAMALLLAESIRKNPLRHRVRIVFFAAEEAGLIGSTHYVQQLLATAPETAQKIKLVLNLDLMSAGDKGMTVVNGTVHQDIFDRLTALNNQHQYLPLIKPRGKAANSDHYPFSEAGIPAIFCYAMGGTTHYHDPGDTLDRCTLTHVKRTHDLLLALLRSL